MLLSKQQKFILGIVRDFGCVKREQLTKFYIAHSPMPVAQAERQLNAMLRQMRYYIGEILLDDETVRIDGAEPNAYRLEAIDVMLELTGGTAPLYKARLPPPLLLRFSFGGEDMVVFTVMRFEDMTAATETLRTCNGQRVIWLSDYLPADGAMTLPPNHFLAVRKQDGTHGFYGSNEL